MSSTSQPDIKDPEIRRLAVELADLTGESVQQALTEALRLRLEKERQGRPPRGRGTKSREGIAERLMEIGRRASRLPVLDPRSPDEMLYDEDGLPK